MSGLLVQNFHLNGDSYYYSLDKYLCLTTTLTWESHIIIIWIVGSVINMLLIIARTYIFSFYSLVMAASSDHPETMKATRSLDNSEVQSFS